VGLPGVARAAQLVADLAARGLREARRRKRRSAAVAQDALATLTFARCNGFGDMQRDAAYIGCIGSGNRMFLGFRGSNWRGVTLIAKFIFNYR